MLYRELDTETQESLLEEIEGRFKWDDIEKLHRDLMAKFGWTVSETALRQFCHRNGYRRGSIDDMTNDDLRNMIQLREDGMCLTEIAEKFEIPVQRLQRFFKPMGLADQ